MTCRMLDWHVTAYNNRARFRTKRTGISSCPSSIIAYNAVKVFGTGVMGLPAKRVTAMLIVEDVVNEHNKFMEENAEARAKVTGA